MPTCLAQRFILKISLSALAAAVIPWALSRRKWSARSPLLAIVCNPASANDSRRLKSTPLEPSRFLIPRSGSVPLRAGPDGERYKKTRDKTPGFVRKRKVVKDLLDGLSFYPFHAAHHPLVPAPFA